MKHSLLISLGVFLGVTLFAQTGANLWSVANEAQLNLKKQTRRIIPQKYQTFRLDLAALQATLSEAPLWQTDAAAKKQVLLTLPMPDGSFEQFRIVEAPVMHPVLAKKFPAIKSFAGWGINDPTAYLRFDLTPQGFHAMILSGKRSDVFIDPYSTTGNEHYIVYYKEDFYKNSDWTCAFDEVNKEAAAGSNLPSLVFDKAGDCKFRTYSLALACTGEYAQFHGGTVLGALSAMTTTLTRVNGVYERDLDVTMQLVANNNLLIYTNPATDPYTNSNGSTMLSENQTTCNNVIGSANYDIGHVFSTGGGGIAYIKAVCNNSIKAGGVTGSSSPVGDPFDIDYVCHEMGHQFGANHTQNNNCNRNAATAVEPGSGSTIMSYAGVCAPNIQARSDAYFHAVSLTEIAAYITGSGNACATVTSIGNAPSISAGADYVIPKSTPFALTGSASDPDANDQLTFCWEQVDNQVATMPPVSTNTGGPTFRSLPPSSSPIRYFPALSTIVNNSTSTWEVLPGVGRTLNFRCTVRDNHPGGGCTKEDDVLVTVDGNSGPFVVTSPNTAVSWAGNSAQTVTWNVAGTNGTPVSCDNVDILLSLDGGYTYPVILAMGTPNDGSQSVTMPNQATTQARVMIRGSGNIFFDISNANFTVTETAGTPLAVTASGTSVTCFGNQNGSATANPTGGAGNYAYAWSNGASTQSISGLAAGTYTVTVTSDGSTATTSVSISQPAKVTVMVAATNATSGNNGSASATPSGGTGSYSYAWSNGGTSQTITGLGAGTYTVTVSDANGCKATGSATVSAPQVALKFEYGVLSGVTNQWQTVTLDHSYTSMVVVASIARTETASASTVTRIQNASGNSFQIKIQVAGNAAGTAGPAIVHYMVAEEGVYNQATHGVKFEAKKYTSVKTSRSVSWQYESRTYGQSYALPVVLGQVMSYNDANWSVFWACKNGSRSTPPTGTSLSIGKQIAEDGVNVNRANEVLGYMVFEQGSGFINGVKYATAVGSDIVKGLSNSSTGFAYPLSGFASINAAVVAAAAMDGSEGSWPVLFGSTISPATLKTYVVEDQVTDSERSHTTEQVAYIVFGNSSTPTPRPDEVPEETSDDVQLKSESILTAYPNPAGGLLYLEFDQAAGSGPVFTVHDVSGRIVLKETIIPAEAGIRRTSLDVSRLQPGYYLLEVNDGEKKRMLKLVKS
jgi:hypothetical protein